MGQAAQNINQNGMTEQAIGGQHLHRSVLLDEALDWWMQAREPQASETPGGTVFIDCTFGRGGHSQALLAQVSEGVDLIVFDKDPSAIQVAQDLKSKALEKNQRVHVVHDSFATLAMSVEELGFSQKVNGILMDLGVSSPQLDEADRGFSFMRNGPLDMRMDSSRGITAAQWLHTVDEKELADILYILGEEKLSRKIARKIVQVRSEQPIETTSALADLVCQVVPRRGMGKHPATRTFQAIRMHINAELDDLQSGLVGAFEALAPGGSLVVLSFHSLEDRIVKRFMHKLSKPEELPRGLPIRASEIAPPGKVLVKGQKPREHEVGENPRARSAILRVIQKI